MRLLTFNHYSIDESSTIDEVNNFFLELSKGIKKYILENGIKNSRFFTELEDFIRYEIIVGYKIVDAIKSLSRDLQSIILDLITMRCNDDCLNKLSEEDEEKIIDYEIIFPDEAPKNDYMILSFVLEKHGILLSFNRGRWIDSTIEVLKYKDGLTKQAYIDNIATEEHANTLIKKIILKRLPTHNIIYSDSFCKWLFTWDMSNREKIIDNILEANNQEFKYDGFFLKSLDNEISQIKVGTAGGIQKGAIRVLFKFENQKTYILHGLLKQGSNTYDYGNDIRITNKIFEDIKKETNEI